MNHVYLNGRFVHAERACVSVFDRGFLYGDGLFETVRVFRGRPFRWGQHVLRLQSGAAALRIQLPVSPDDLACAAAGLIRRNGLSDGTLRIALSRGPGPRGYSAKNAGPPTLVISTHSGEGNPGRPRPWRLATASCRLGPRTLAEFKTANKLIQVVARAEAEERGAHEALLLDHEGYVAEAAGGNVFWAGDRELFTTPLSSPILPGVTRGVVLSICRELGIPVQERRIRPKELTRSEGAFLTMSSLGVVGISAVDGVKLRRVVYLPRIKAAYRRTLAKESKAPAW